MSVFLILQHAHTQSEDALKPLLSSCKGFLVSLLPGFHKVPVVLFDGRRDDTWRRELQAVCQWHEILIPTNLVRLASVRDELFQS